MRKAERSLATSPTSRSRGGFSRHARDAAVNSIEDGCSEESGGDGSLVQCTDEQVGIR